jgi:hypothetical protein
MTSARVINAQHPKNERIIIIQTIERRPNAPKKQKE